MTFDEIIAHLDRDRASHTTSGPSDEEELRRTEQAIGHCLPAPFRSFLARMGGGIFYGRHEVFGCHRVMIHDIELVPSLRSVRDALARQTPAPGPQMLPFHRADGRVHVLDLSAPAGGEVLAWPSGEPRGGFADFLESMVLRGAAER